MPCRDLTIPIQTREFVATVVVPNLRGILVEEERIVQASTAVLNAFVLPTLKSRTRYVQFWMGLVEG